MQSEHPVPLDGLPGLLQNWRNDLIAGLCVALVALPLGLGIAIASGFPPVSGLLSAIIGGLITTFVRGSHLAINGPPSGLIVVLLGALETLRDDTGTSLPYVLAAVVVAGALQVGLGLFRLGRVGDLIPTSVIHGMLAAIGLIILAKQTPLAVGAFPQAHTALRELLAIPTTLLAMNPAVAVVAAVSLAVMLIHPHIHNRTVHFLPGPLWVLLFSVPLALWMDLGRPHSIHFHNSDFNLGPHFLIQIPKDLRQSIMFPDFSRLHEVEFWTVVISICLVATIETVLSSKALDKIDAYGRRTDLNRDLMAVGASTMLCGGIGGLPTTTVISRSAVNVNHGAKTRWANFFHGLLVLLMLMVFPNLIRDVPLAALAAILMVTGFKLAAPKVFKDALRRGNEELVILLVTLIVTLEWGLLPGIGLGIAFAVLLHWTWSAMDPLTFLRYAISPDFQVEQQGQTYFIKVRGAATFLNLAWMVRKLTRIPDGCSIIVDLAHAKLIDATTQEYLSDYGERYVAQGGTFDLLGLSLHAASSNHPFAMRRLLSDIKETTRVWLSPRQRKLQALADAKGYAFDPNVHWDKLQGRPFHFFETRPIEFRSNIISGNYPELGVTWRVEDVTFDEGAFFETEEHHTTLHYMKLPVSLPRFSLEKRVVLDRLLDIAGYEEVNFVAIRDISTQFHLTAPPGEPVRELFRPELLAFLEQNRPDHLESNGEALILFKYSRLAGPTEVEAMVEYSESLVSLLLRSARPHSH